MVSDREGVPNGTQDRDDGQLEPSATLVETTEPIHRLSASGQEDLELMGCRDPSDHGLGALPEVGVRGSAFPTRGALSGGAYPIRSGQITRQPLEYFAADHRSVLGLGTAYLTRVTKRAAVMHAAFKLASRAYRR
jgi:hypothetical protein